MKESLGQPPELKFVLDMPFHRTIGYMCWPAARCANVAFFPDNDSEHFRNHNSMVLQFLVTKVVLVFGCELGSNAGSRYGKIKYEAIDRAESGVSALIGRFFERDYALYRKRHPSASTYMYEIRKGNEFLALADRFDAALAEIYTKCRR
jgi:hypothetical protein